MPGPFLVVVPLSTISNWEREFQFWAPQLNVVIYVGNATSRQLIREYEFYRKDNNKQIRFNVVITTYELVLKDRTLTHF